MVLFFLRLSIRQIRRPHNEFHLLRPMLLRLHTVRSLIFPLVAKAPTCHRGQEAQCLHRKASPFLPELSKNLRGHSLRLGGPSYRKREDNELALFASWCLVGTSGSPLKAGLLYWVDTCSFCRDLTWKPKATSCSYIPGSKFKALLDHTDTTSGWVQNFLLSHTHCGNQHVGPHEDSSQDEAQGLLDTDLSSSLGHRLMQLLA